MRKSLKVPEAEDFPSRTSRRNSDPTHNHIGQCEQRDGAQDHDRAAPTQQYLVEIIPRPSRRVDQNTRFGIGNVDAPLEAGELLHLGAQRQLAFAEPVGAVFRKLLGAAGSLVSATTGAIGAFVHLAARTKIADHRILRRPERAGIEAIAAADAQILVVQHDAVFGRIDADDRANGRTGRVDAMHAGHRYRALARFSVIDGNDAPPVDSPRHLILVLGGSDAGVAIDAAVRVAKELHPCHRSLLYAALIWHSA